MSNKRVKGSITIHKEDTKNGAEPLGDATLSGAVYGLFAKEAILDPADDSVIYNKDDKVAELTTNNNATATINDLYLSRYYLKELSPSTGYTLDESIYEVELNYENQNVEVVTKSETVKERVKSQPFQIIKVSSDDVGETELLEGIEFTIKLKSDIEKYGSWENAPIAKNANAQTAAKLITDSKGYAISERLPYGTYVVRETKVADEKLKVPDFEVRITEDSSEPQVWRVFNDTTFKAVLKIVKKDAETDKTILVKGAKFKIKNLDTNEYWGYWDWNPLPHYVDTWTTDETGTVMTNNELKAANYQLEEQESPKGYLLSEEPIKFKITTNAVYQTLPDGATVVIEAVQKDTSVKGQINVEKRGEVLTSFTDGKFIYEEKGLAGAEYDIIARTDILDPADATVIYEEGTIVDTITTNSDGKATSKLLPLGEYIVVEKKAPNRICFKW